jgi:hypothetical protein
VPDKDKCPTIWSIFVSVIDFGWQERSAVEPNVTHVLDGLYQVLRNYHIYATRLDRLKQTVKNLVKPDNITKFAYIDIV